MRSLAESSTSADAAGPIPFDNSYARLPEAFYQRVKPLAVAAPRLLRVNDALACQLRIDPKFLESPEGVAVLSGNEIASGSEPIAQAYAGHQFGDFVPQLGDGRAVLLGEVVDVAGKRFDLQLKGSGRTRFSRGGDGRAALGPVIREYIVSEAMAALGIPTTRSLAAVLARLSARWMLVGFIHGVLNTDNTAIGGETIDYGPCAFIDAYRPDKVFSYIDQFGRYAFANQPAAVGWNLARFGETLLPLIADGGDRRSRTRV